MMMDDDAAADEVSLEGVVGDVVVEVRTRLHEI